MSLFSVHIFMYSYSDDEMHPVLLASYYLIHENLLCFSKLEVASGALINMFKVCILEYFKCGD